MKQLIENLKNGKLSIIDVPVPHCGPNDILVRNIYSLVSPGTEKSMIELGKKNLVGKAVARPDLAKMAFQKAKREGFISVFKEALARLDQPMPLGYSSSGVVLKVGRNVQDIAVDDYVACAGSAYASHAEVISLPRDLAVKIPKEKIFNGEVRLEDASFVMLGGIALQGFRSAQMSFGETVVVVGLGLIGLLTAQIAKAYGCTVIGVDVDSKKTAMGKLLGCDRVFTIGKDDIETGVLNVTSGHGADAILLCAATKDNKPILLAETIVRKKGKIVLIGVSDITLTRKQFWDKEISFTVSKASGPWVEGREKRDLPLEHIRWTERRNHEEFIRLLSSNLVHVDTLITHRYPIENAIDAYTMILQGRERYIGVLIQYSGTVSALSAATDDQNIVRMNESGFSHSSDVRSAVGFIGAGAFTKNILLPQLAGTKTARFVGISAKTGLHASHLAGKYGFSYTTTSYKKILEDQSIGSVIITTRHNLHAGMVEEALSAGKNVYVEKPLCINKQQLQRLEKVFRHTPPDQLFFIGFNRRYAPLSKKLKEYIATRTSPMQMVYRVNAGFIPYDHWVHDVNIGGGRIIGEVCHFIDFMLYLTDADPIEVSAHSIGNAQSRYRADDNLELSLRFSDGSLGTIIYTALGSKSASRERVELFVDESVCVLEDFRRLEIIRGAEKKVTKLWGQDMGYADALQTFLSLSPEKGYHNRQQSVQTTKATFASLDSLRSKKSETI